jgi:hypothetical protein
MIVLAKSSSYLTADQVKQHIAKCCPLRLFKHVNIVDDPDQGLCYCYRMPSKAKLDLSLMAPVDDCLFDYLCDNELRLNKLGEQQFIVNSLRSIQNDARTAIKEFCTGLSVEQLEKFSPRITALQDAINNDCAPHVTRTINNLWNSTIRQPLFKSIKQVQL